MSKYQVAIVATCLALVMAEGYDLLIMAFAASGVAKEWSLGGVEVGMLLSSALVGMAAGSAVLAPLADRIGRRPLTLGCLVIATLGIVLSTMSTGFAQLGICRLLTGLGIGGLVASLPVLTSEFSPRRLRGTMIALYTTGLPLGGVVGGAVATLLTSELGFGWRGLFIVGAGLTFIMLVLVYVVMPESIDYLQARRPPNALEKINAILPKMGIATVETLPEQESTADRGVRIAILAGRNGVRSLLLGTAFFIMMAGFYFAASWTPRLLEQSGLSAQQGISGGMLVNLGGVAATLIFSALAIVVASRKLTVVALVGAGVSFLAMSLSFGSLTSTLVAAVAVGVFINASATGLYAVTPDLYPASVRTTAVGWASAVGRLGAIVSPVMAGILIDNSWTPPSLFALFAIPMLVAAIAVVAIPRPKQGTSDSKPDIPAKQRAEAPHE